jgi:hypothetical protein
MMGASRLVDQAEDPPILEYKVVAREFGTRIAQPFQRSFG